ncbi:uncharacterized protein LOC131957377 isoform X2 [Physella acuta]|uniref:uncharacterized protein LOC131957377 isoform X2 n=1 Tax=Physella acuta TaxID=109671 RepID=UPI0027DD936D|nr:uncharacterized protein LOC131957377 isoform X2 [Physella acuta]
MMNWRKKAFSPANMKPGFFKRKINSALKASIHGALSGRPPVYRNMSTANGDIATAEAVELAETKKTVTSFVGMYIIVSLTVALAWLLGYFDFSFLWVFISIASLFVVWKAKISKIITQHLCQEEATLYRKRAFRQNETAEWFNFLLNRWWVFSASNIEELVKKHLDERLWDIRPSFVDSLEVSSFSIGEQTPNFKNVRVFECSETTPGSLQPISWFNVHRPPAGLVNLSSYQVVIETDVSMMSEDFKMIFRGRVGSSKVNVGFDMAVQDLHLSGTMQAIVSLSMDIPFPHISKATICFKEKPDVTFNIQLLRALSLMEIPLLKSWVHNNVMEGLTKAMVDPASVDIHINKVGPTLMGQTTSKKKKAQGVLTIQIKGYPPKDPACEDVRYSVLTIGPHKRQTHEVPATDEWEDVCSFFIHNLATDKIKIKSKCKRLITSTTLEQNEVNLSTFPFQVNHVCETTIENKDESKMVLTMQYTALPDIKLMETEEIPASKSNTVAGVLYVCVHGATNVLAADKTGASDPYCVLFCDRRRVLTTPFVPRTRNPRWESWVEFFVADYSRSSLSFFLYDWDGTNTINDDFLGSVHVKMSESCPEMIKKTYTLGYNKPDEGFTEDKKCGQLTVSIIFRPVQSVAKSEKFRDAMKGYKPNDYLYKEDLMSPSTRAGFPGRKSTTASYMNDLLSNKVIVELTILQGIDMVAMDRNGFSDPYCVVSVKDKKVYTTAVKKKTLFPKWNETVTTEMSLIDGHNLTIDVFDKDVISKDFMGSLTLSIDDLKELSIKGTAEWFPLEKIKKGKLQLKCHVISKDGLNQMKEGSPSPDGVFDFPPVGHPNLDISDSSIGSPNTSLDHVALQAPPKTHVPPIKRTPSQLALNDHPANNNNETLPRQRMKRADSSNSVNMMQRLGDRASLYSSASVTEKLFSVSGKILRVRGEFSPSATEIYCKVRLEIPGNRLSLFHNTRVIGKSQLVPIHAGSPNLNTEFEVDKGSGISMDAVLIFNLKHSRKEHVATKSIPLRTLLADADGVPKWVSLSRSVEIELLITQGQASPGHRRRSGSLLKSLSFRKDNPT